MTPQVLRQTLLRIVNLKLTPKELGAVFINFQGADGTVSSTLFLQAFVRAGVEQRDLWAHMRQMKVRAREDKERAALTNGLTRQREAMKADAAVDFGFDERDAESAKDKLTRAALSYNKFSTTAPSLEVALPIPSTPWHCSGRCVCCSCSRRERYQQLRSEMR